MKIYKVKNDPLDESYFGQVGLSGLFASCSMDQTTTLLNGEILGRWNYFSLKDIKRRIWKDTPLVGYLFGIRTYDLVKGTPDKDESIW